MLEESDMALLESESLVVSKKDNSLQHKMAHAKVLSHLEEERRLRHNLSRYLVLIVSSLCMYTLVLGHIRQLNKMFASASYVTLALTLVFVVLVVVLTLTSGYKFEEFGITLKNGKRALGESILLTIPVLLGMTFVKWVLIQFIPAYHHQILFHFHAGLHPDLRGTPDGAKIWIITLILYALICAPLQELVSRGGVQSGLSLFMSGKHRHLIAIFITSLIFSTTHLAFPFHVVVLSFVVGLFWGWLFYRHKTLLGVCVSHALIGVWFFWLLGVFT